MVPDPVPLPPRSAAAGGPSGSGRTRRRRMDEEERLQAAIAMTQLSTSSEDQVRWRHLVVGGSRREEEEQKEDETVGGRVTGGISEKQTREEVVVMEGVKNGPADPETGEGRETPEGNDSTSACRPAHSGTTGQKLTGDSCGASKTKGEDRDSLVKSCDYAEERNAVLLGSRSQPGRNPSDCGIGGEAMPAAFPSVGAVDKSSSSGELCIRGKFVRTAQPSNSVGAVWMDRTSEKNLTGKCSEDSLTVSSEVTPVVVKRKTTRASVDADRPSKTPRQRKTPKNAPTQTTQCKRGSSKNARQKSNGNGDTPPADTTRESERSLARDTPPDHAVRGMVFAFNPQGGFLIPMAPLAAPIPTMIVEAERQLLAWMPSNVASFPRGLSLTTTAPEFVSSALLPPSFAASRSDLIPRVNYALPSVLPASVSFSEDVDGMISSGAATATRSTTSKRKREKHRSIPGGKSGQVPSRTNYSSNETFQSGAFQVKEKAEAGDIRSSEIDTEGQSIKNDAITEHNLDNQITRRIEFESNKGVDLSTRKLGNRIVETPKIVETTTIGETPKIGETSKIWDNPQAFEIKTESKSFTEPETNFGSCNNTSPLDLTTHWGSYGSLGSLKNFYTLSGSTTTTIEKHDNHQGAFINSRDNTLNRIPNTGPTDFDLNRLRHGDVPRTRGLVQSFRHGPVIDNIKGTTTTTSPPPVRPTSLMIYEKKSPFAESTEDKYKFTQAPTCSSFTNSAPGSPQEAKMNLLTDPELQVSSRRRWERSLLQGSVRDLSKGAAGVTSSPPVLWGHGCATVALEDAGRARPGSQCSSDLQLESPSRVQQESRLPPKKRKMPVDFDQEVQPHRGDLDGANGQDLSKASSREESPWKVTHLEQTTTNYHNHHQQQHHPLVVPLPTKDGPDGGGELAQRLREPIPSLEIVLKLEFREREDPSDGKDSFYSR